MENSKILKKEAKLLKDDSKNYLLELVLDGANKVVINISDSEQKTLDEEYAKLVRYCIKEENNFNYELQIDSTIDTQKDNGVIDIVTEYLNLLNNEISTVCSKWKQAKTNFEGSNVKSE